MQNTEALLLHKFPFGEADYIISLLTKDAGKISGIAKNAKKSTKRFGARLEPFVHIRVRYRERDGHMKFIEDTETVGQMPGFSEDIELFMWGSFLLELTDILTAIEEPNEGVFELLLGALGALNSGESKLPVVLDYLQGVLVLGGVAPGLDECVECGRETADECVLSIEKGGVLCETCGVAKGDGYKINKEFLGNRDLMEIQLKETLRHVKILTEYAEYHSDKELKSKAFLEDINL